MKFVSVIFVLVVFLVVIADVASVSASDLRTEEVGPGDIKGTFDLILYGGRYFMDVETAAFLDVEGDLYKLEPYAPDFDYRIIRGLSAKEALERAGQFVSGQYDFWRSLLSRIIDERGKTVGYEVRPLYHVPTFGVPDVMNIDYVTKGDKIRIYIRLKPDVERQLFSGEGLKHSGH